jgi:hypothetical protein
MRTETRDSSTPIIKFAMAFMVMIWLNKLFKSLFAFFGSENSEATKKKDEEELHRVDKEIKYDYLTHKKSYYYTLANGIYSAIQDGYFTEDEQAVYNILKKLWNNSDYLMLKKAWGRRPIGYTGFRTPMTLERAIRYWFNEKEVKHCNYILANQKGKFITLRI